MLIMTKERVATMRLLPATIPQIATAKDRFLLPTRTHVRELFRWGYITRIEVEDDDAKHRYYMTQQGREALKAAEEKVALKEQAVVKVAEKVPSNPWELLRYPVKVEPRKSYDWRW